MLHKTKIGVDSAKLLIIDPLYLRETDLPEKLNDLPETDPSTGFVSIGPAGLGLLLSPTGWGDGTYEVEIETFADGFVDPPDVVRIDRVTISFTDQEHRLTGDSDTILEAVNKSFDMASEGAHRLETAITDQIEAGCAVPVAIRLINALTSVQDARARLGDAFAYLYSGKGCWPGATQTEPDYDTPF